MMKKISHNKGWMSRKFQIHVDTPPIPLIKSDIDTNLEKDYVKIKLRRNTMLETYDMYDFKMALFDNFEPKEFLLFERNYNFATTGDFSLWSGIRVLPVLETSVCLKANEMNLL